MAASCRSVAVPGQRSPASRATPLPRTTILAAGCSSDALTWRQAQRAASFTDGSRMAAVVAAAPGFGAVGNDAVGAVIWTSTDCTTWSPVPGLTGAAAGGLQAVGLAGSTIVAVGHDATGAAAWTSPDGLTWTRATVAAPPGATGSAMTVFP